MIKRAIDSSDQVVISTVLMAAGVVLLPWYFIFGPVSFVLSSIVIVLLIALVALRHGLISIPFVVVSAAYIPTTAFLWAYLHSTRYINAHNYWLQDDAVIVNSAVHFSMASLFCTCAMIIPFNKIKLYNVRLIYREGGLARSAYVIACIASGFFFWLAEPSFTTIITSSYSDLLVERFDGAQYAGSLAVILWLLSFVTYSSNCSKKVGKERIDIWLNRLFLFVTFVSVVWLVLHARRSELIGIGFVWLLVVAERKGARQAALYAATFILLLIGVAQVRTLSVMAYFDGVVMVGDVMGYVSIPGGASNIFMTYVDSVHYFTTNTWFYGETFLNYALQILPTNLYSHMQIDTPEYFSQKVLSGYSYNGGTYVGAVFFGNFGVFGVVIFGVFVGFYIIAICSALLSQKTVMRVIGLYMFAMVFRGFWYELITIIKPIVIVLLPAYYFSTLLRKNR